MGNHQERTLRRQIRLKQQKREAEIQQIVAGAVNAMMSGPFWRRRLPFATNLLAGGRRWMRWLLAAATFLNFYLAGRVLGALLREVWL